MKQNGGKKDMSGNGKTYSLAFRINASDVTPSSTRLIRQRLRATFDNFVSAGLLSKGFVEVIEIRGEEANAKR